MGIGLLIHEYVFVFGIYHCSCACVSDGLVVDDRMTVMTVSLFNDNVP